MAGNYLDGLNPKLDAVVLAPSSRRVSSSNEGRFSLRTMQRNLALLSVQNRRNQRQITQMYEAVHKSNMEILAQLEVLAAHMIKELEVSRSNLQATKKHVVEVEAEQATVSCGLEEDTSDPDQLQRYEEDLARYQENLAHHQQNLAHHKAILEKSKRNCLDEADKVFNLSSASCSLPATLPSQQWSLINIMYDILKRALLSMQVAPSLTYRHIKQLYS